MQKLVNFLKANYMDVGLLWMRVLTGLGIMTHGYRKLFAGNMDGFITGVHNIGFPIPEFFAWAAALSEFVGGWMLVLGIGTRFAALFILGTLFVAAFIRHGDDPFSAREKALTYLTLSGTICILGAGKYSLDHLIRSTTRTTE